MQDKLKVIARSFVQYVLLLTAVMYDAQWAGNILMGTVWVLTMFAFIVAAKGDSTSKKPYKEIPMRLVLSLDAILLVMLVGNGWWVTSIFQLVQLICIASVFEDVRKSQIKEAPVG